MNTYTIKHFKSLNSTNTYALDNFDKLNHGDIIVADVQTSGKGRFDRVWQADSDENLYMTIVLKPDMTDRFPFMNLTQYLSVTINKIFNNKYGITSKLKWPNDILFEDKKLVGILAELKMSKNKVNGVIIGAGINVNYAPVDIVPKSTSLKMILSKTIDKNEVMKYILQEFFNNLELFSKQGFKSIYDEYSSMCEFTPELKIGNSYKEGEFNIYKFKKLNNDGTLTVTSKNTNSNNEIKIISGDIIC